MHVSSYSKLTVIAFALAAAAPLFADITYQETTQTTGGSLLSMMKMAGTFSKQARKSGDPVVSTVYYSGNRMARVSPDSMEIIDLDKETITTIDQVKKTYSVRTFQQIKDQMAKSQQAITKKETSKGPAAPTKSDASNVNMSFDVKVRNTGASKQVSGLDAKEAIMTMTMNATDQSTQQTGALGITNDMWMVPELPGYEEVRNFQLRMAEKMGLGVPTSSGMDFSRMLAQNPGAMQAVEDMGKELQKLKGVPVMQIMRLGMTANGQAIPAASEAPLPADQAQTMPSGGDVFRQGAGDIARQSAEDTAGRKGGELARQSTALALASRFGGFGGFGKKKQAEAAAPAAAPSTSTSSSAQGSGPTSNTSSVLMEVQTTTSGFSSAPLASSYFEVPAGYKESQHTN